MYMSRDPPSGIVVVTAGAAGLFGNQLADWRIITKGGFKKCYVGLLD